MKEKKHIGRPINEEVANRKKKKIIKYSLLTILLMLLVGGIFLYLNKDSIDFGSLMGNSSSIKNKMTVHEEFLLKAEEIHTYIEKNNYVYGHDRPGPDKTNKVNCISYVTWVLKELGYIDKIYFGCKGFYNDYKDSGIFQIFSKVEDLQPGDIVFQLTTNSPKEEWAIFEDTGVYISHAAIYAGKNDKGEYTWYDTGNNNYIKTNNPIVYNVDDNKDKNITKGDYVFAGIFRLKDERSKLQDFVVSTALSYYYNNIYSDYDQHALDSVINSYGNFWWRNITNSPEMVNRGNRYNIDCSSFAFMTYYHSLGYDMSQHRQYMNVDAYLTKGFERTISGGDSKKEDFINGYLYYGTGWHGTANVVSNLLAGKDRDDIEPGTEIINTGEKIIYNGKELDNKSDILNSEAIYYYKVNLGKNDKGIIGYKESKQKVDEVEKNITDILQPGDVLTYRRYYKDSNTYTGHVILYVGDVINDGEKGFIHSTGKDFRSDGVLNPNGEDQFSVRYDTWDDNFKTSIFYGFNTDINYSFSNPMVSYDFAIFRPINSYCNKYNCKISVDNNTIARNNLSNLRIEQYVSTNEKEVNTTLSKYNSVNNGDKVTYNLELTNMSEFNYCSRGAYINENECTSNGYKWLISKKNSKIYENIKVIGYIPEGTKYISCKEGCKINDNTVTWSISSIKQNEKVNLSYTVQSEKDKDITNPGIEILYSDSTLKLGELNTKVNPTLNNSSNIEKMENIINNYSSKTNKVETLTSIYKEFLGIDLSYLAEDKKLNTFGDNILNSIFNSKMSTNDGKGYMIFEKKIDNTILTNSTSKNINKMLVKGMYGGRRLKGNNNKDRIRYSDSWYLEYGDIIVAYHLSAKGYDRTNLKHIYIYRGLDSQGEPILSELGKDGTITTYNSSTEITGYSTYRNLYLQGIFVVLRPTQLYGTTINYEYNGATTKGDNSFVAYGTYGILSAPKKKTTINLIYNKESSEKLEISNKFAGWYSDNKFTKKLTTSTKLNSTTTHTIYAKWNSDTITLPSVTKSNTKIEGWYSDSSLKKKVANGGEKYTASKNITLYAKIAEENPVAINKYSYDNNKKYIDKIDINTTVESFKKNIKLNEGYSIEVDYKNVNGKNILYTGSKTKIYNNNNLIVEYTNIIRGEVTGDGKINYLDYVSVYNHIQKIKNPESTKKELTNEYLISADISEDGKVSYLDYVKIYNKIKELKGGTN